MHFSSLEGCSFTRLPASEADQFSDRMQKSMTVRLPREGCDSATRFSESSSCLVPDPERVEKRSPG